MQSRRSEFEERGQWSQGRERRGRQEEESREQQNRYRNVFTGFEDRILAEAFNIDTELARRLKNENDMRGIIVRVKHEFGVVAPELSREEEERIQEQESRQDRRREYNGVEETFCTARMRHNINNPEQADFFNPNAGRLTTVTSNDLPILERLQLSAQKGVLYRVRN